MDDLAARSVAESTRRTYASALTSFTRWCEARDLPHLPASPQTVAAYLADVTTVRDATGRIAFDDDGRAVRGRLRAVSATVHLQAVDDAHRHAGHPPPGASDHVRKVLRGIRRTHGVRPENDRDPLDLVGLRAVVAAARETPLATRDRVLLLLVGAGLTSARAAGLVWTELDVDPAGTTVRLDGVALVRVPGTGGDACPVVTLRSRHAQDRARPGTAVLVSAGGEPMTPRAVNDVVHRAVGSTPTPERLLAAARPRETLASARDRLLLLLGWAAALRRQGLVGLSWHDVEDRGDRLKLLVRRGKTDQEGQGHVVWVTPARDPELCPVLAFRRWRTLLATRLDRDPAPRSPVLCGVDRHDRPRLDTRGEPARMSDNGVRKTVTGLCNRAGLEGRWGAHSLRAGFVTEAANTPGVDVLAIAEVTGHRDLDVLARYARAARLARGPSLTDRMDY